MRTFLQIILAIVIVGVVILILFRAPDNVVTVSGPQESLEDKKDLAGSMIFVGDIMLSRSVGDLMKEKGDYKFPFLKVSEFLKRADITFGNLENPVSLGGVRVGSIYSFRADPKTIEGLTYSGFDIVSIANNHIWDYSREAFMDTLRYLKDVGIDYVGGGNNFDEAHNGVIRNVRDVKVSFLAYTDLIPKGVSATKDSAGVSFLDLDQMVIDIQKAKSLSDIVVVSFHWGDEYKTEHNLTQESIAKSAIDAGASLIIGHHPHVVQEVEQYKDAWIAYSLGNFIFDQTFSQATMSGLALRVNIEEGRISTVERINIDISRSYQASLKE